MAAYAMAKVCTTGTVTLALAITGAVSFVAYVVVGNICRKNHEDNNTANRVGGVIADPDDASERAGPP
jgi:hypothetical protein